MKFTLIFVIFEILFLFSSSFVKSSQKKELQTVNEFCPILGRFRDSKWDRIRIENKKLKNNYNPKFRDWGKRKYQDLRTKESVKANLSLKYNEIKFTLQFFYKKAPRSFKCKNPIKFSIGNLQSDEFYLISYSNSVRDGEIVIWPIQTRIPIKNYEQRSRNISKKEMGFVNSIICSRCTKVLCRNFCTKLTLDCKHDSDVDWNSNKCKCSQRGFVHSDGPFSKCEYQPKSESDCDCRRIAENKNSYSKFCKPCQQFCNQQDGKCDCNPGFHVSENRCEYFPTTFNQCNCSLSVSKVSIFKIPYECPVCLGNCNHTSGKCACKSGYKSTSQSQYKCEYCPQSLDECNCRRKVSHNLPVKCFECPECATHLGSCNERTGKCNCKQDDPQLKSKSCKFCFQSNFNCKCGDLNLKNLQCQRNTSEAFSEVCQKNKICFSNLTAKSRAAFYFVIIILLVIVILMLTSAILFWRYKLAEKTFVFAVMDYLTIPNKSREISTREFPILIKRALKFEKDHNLTQSIATASENKSRNRYQNMLPYDHTIVTLTSQNSFINASQVKGIRGQDGLTHYIATQGPLKSTMWDFWRMIEEKNVSVIVMLTLLIENDTPKCHQYWPVVGETFQSSTDEEDAVIKVTCLEETSGRDGVNQADEEANQEEEYTNFIANPTFFKRVFKLTKNNAEDNQQTVTQYQFMKWADHGTPEPACFYSFYRAVAEDLARCTAEISPILVHCSAGVGRTGVFIAIHEMVRQTCEPFSNHRLNVFNTVLHLRHYRPNLVEKSSQYKFIFDYLAHHLRNETSNGVHDVNTRDDPNDRYECTAF